MEFVDCSGSRLLLESCRRAGDQGRRLVIMRGSARIDRVFALTGIDRRLEFIDASAAGCGDVAA